MTGDPWVERLARRFRALGEPTRLSILSLLGDGEMNVQELTIALGTSQQNASKHLGLLHEAGFVRRRKHGTYARYSVADPIVFELLELVGAGIEDELDALRRTLDEHERRRPAPGHGPQSGSPPRIGSGR